MKKNFRVFEKSDDDGFHVIYRMLGLKLKVFNVKASLRDLREQVEDLKSRINRDNADLVAAMWETYGCTDFLLKHFDFISHSRLCLAKLLLPFLADLVFLFAGKRPD